MTEGEWLTCDDPQAMIEWLRKDWKHSLFEIGRWLGVARQSDKERRLRLFACACLRLAWGSQPEKDRLSGDNDTVPDATGRASVEAAERYADGRATWRELAAAGERYGLPAAAGASEPFAADSARRAADAAVRAIAGTNNVDDPARRPARAQVCGLLRDIFGPLPFRSSGISPRAQGPVVHSLAKACYEERLAPEPGRAGWLTLDPARLSVLADALLEAGCDSEELLSHLRAEGPHVRGCWALDLVLGKE